MPPMKSYLFVAVGCLLCASCASVPRQAEVSDYEAEIQRLRQQLVQDPNDADAMRELGVIYARTRQFSQASEYLQQAYSREPDDPEVLFYLGLTNESLGKRQTALRLYEQYTNVPRGSEYRKLMMGRYEWLIREMAREQMQALIAEEQERPTSPQTVAVFPLVYLGDNDQYAPLGRGLAELMTVDLASVQRLQVVERVRLQALLNELELAQSAYVDPETAPRTGHLLGAGRIVGGNYNVLDDDIRLDRALVDVERAADPNVASHSEALNNLFRLEAELVFALLDEMGIEPTPQERDAIEQVPTQNLQAFLAYSRGLQAEDAGNFDAAFRFYQQAQQLDPGFSAAGGRAEAMDGMAVVAGSPGEALMAVAQLEPPPMPTVDLLGHRMGLLGASINANLVPGLDTRQPTQEVPALPEPPPPPSRE